MNAPLTCPNCRKPCGLGDATCRNCGYSLTAEDGDTTRLREAVTQADNCPHCGQPYHHGDQVCLACGHFLQMELHEDTSDLTDEFAEKLKAEWSHAGSQTARAEAHIILDIEGTQVTLPPGDVIVIGRRSSKSSDAPPDLDLTAFAAHEKGVSRRHISIKRRGTLAYVADIGSANGTWLNGRYLILNGERVLRHGDELQLSHLKIRVLYGA